MTTSATERPDRLLFARREAIAHAASLVGGVIRKGGGPMIDLTDPATGEVYASYQSAESALVAEAVASACRGYRSWSGLKPADRGRVLNTAANLITRDAERLALLEAWSAGKPLRDARGEVARVAEMFEHYAGWCDKLTGEVISVPSGHLNYTQRVPYGVVAQITPWNAPIFTAGWQLAPALAAGNAVVLKPSEFTPASSVALGLLLIEAGVPADAISILAGNGANCGDPLIRSRDVRKVVFVGSVTTGSLVAQVAALAPKPCVLELGGKSANIVFDDANLDRAVAGAAAGIFGSAGQSCVAGSRLLVQRSIVAEVLERLRDTADAIVLGDPLDDRTQMGPINNRRQFDRIAALVAQGIYEGVELIVGGAPAADCGEGFFYPPTVLLAKDSSSQIVREEVFGPVLTVVPFDDEDKAIGLANSSQFGLAGAVWTKDVARAHRVAGQLEAGTVWINSYKAINVVSPFGGFKDSGYGRSSGREGLGEYTQSRSVWVETAAAPSFQFDYR